MRVTWNDAAAFCTWLGSVEGKDYRLPTEAQWEYACRAGTTTQWFFGNDAAKSSDYVADTRSVVGQKRPNAFSLCDLYGNVAEWCWDWYSAEYYSESRYQDPTGPVSGEYRVQRGQPNTYPFRSALRTFDRPDAQSDSLGFRAVMMLSEKE